MNHSLSPTSNPTSHGAITTQPPFPGIYWLEKSVKWEEKGNEAEGSKEVKLRKHEFLETLHLLSLGE